MWSNKSLDHTTRQKDFAAAATALATGQLSAQGAITTPFTELCKNIPVRFWERLAEILGHCAVLG